MSVTPKSFTEMSAVEWLEELEGLLATSGIPQTFVIASIGRTIEQGITFMPKQWYDTFIRAHNEALQKLESLGVDLTA